METDLSEARQRLEIGSSMIYLQKPTEAPEDVMIRKQNHEFVRREAHRPGIKFVEWMAGEAARSTRETDGKTGSRKLPLIAGQAALIGALNRTRQQTNFRHWFPRSQTDLPSPMTVPMKSHTDRVELRQQNKINRAVEQTSAREQKPLFRIPILFPVFRA
ncbi:hypothetical protein [uncultured Gimesia sp.]|uniref:hypothetical protein n=1 Tax=uncultured Gimesia sp. TaxID=1678688 RepID=UPI0030D743BA